MVCWPDLGGSAWGGARVLVVSGSRGAVERGSSGPADGEAGA